MIRLLILCTAAAGISGIITLLILFVKSTFSTIHGEERAKKIASYIRRGAYAFLYEEYKIIILVTTLVAFLIYFYANTPSAIAFFLGAFLSLFVGFIGMSSATKANISTALFAKNDKEKSAFRIALCGGGVMGFAVASIGLLGLLICFLYAMHATDIFESILSSFGIGASLVAFFARVGGGIYTKSADVGADLVGKLEQGIPEDDPRNPAVIADNVGDCVGDTAGMGADIYESYVSSMISTIILGAYAHPGEISFILLPLVISGLGTLASVITFGIFFLFSYTPRTHMRGITIVSVLFFLLFSFILIQKLLLPISLFYTLILGCFSGIFVGGITEYYTGGSPIRSLAQSSESGAATNIIHGLSLGMASSVMPVIGLSIAIWGAYWCGGSYGVALAAVAMLATVAIIMTIDGYGPIADTAGGIAEMASFGKKARDITDKLDALGNTTAAVGKGFAIGSALLSALGVFAAYCAKAGFSSLNLLDINVLVGLFIGGTLPFLISSFTMRAVGDAALEMVREVRRQFKSIKGLAEGKVEPDYEKCVQISTRASIQKMILPGILTLLAPISVKYFFGKGGLGGFLVGATTVGILLSLMLSNSGGAWDNAKKYIEAGNFGGKGSSCHTAAVIGDTVGDPCKDTSGPSLNILIKLMSMLALLIVSL